MNQDIENYTKTCKECQLKRSPTYKQYGKLKPQIPSTKPFERLILDFLGPITQSHGYKYILIITDPTTRMAYTRATRSADAKTVAKVLLDVFCLYGCPKVITHDQGTHFMGKVLQQLLHSLGIEQRPSPPYSQHIQGLTERVNLVLKKSYISLHRKRSTQLVRSAKIYNILL
jgi:transposase InsO family protein